MKPLSAMKHSAVAVALAAFGLASGGAYAGESSHGWFQEQLRLSDGYDSSATFDRHAPSRSDTKHTVQKATVSPSGAAGRPGRSVEKDTGFRWMGTANNPWEVNVSP